MLDNMKNLMYYVINNGEYCSLRVRLMVKTFSDNEIALKAKEGDSAALADVFLRFEPYVRLRALSFKSSGLEIEDLVQEGMIGLLSAVRNYMIDCGASFRTFVGICVNRRLISTIKSTSRQKRLPASMRVSLDSPFVENEASTVGLQNDPQEILIDQENMELIKQMIENSLSKFEREVLTLYLAGYPYKQMGIILNKSGKSIDNAIQRIKSKLTNGLA